MISVAEALDACFELIPVMETEEVPLSGAAGRVLAGAQVAQRNQPPFAASAMDGYAVRGIDVQPQAQFLVVGESAAGQGFNGTVRPGQAVRIFTGAPVPQSCDRVIIQEDTTRQGAVITLNTALSYNINIRPEGDDFKRGFTIEGPKVLTPGDIALLAAMNCPKVTVHKRPVVAIMATGDELVWPGETPGPDQIIASNSFGLKAMAEAAGAHVRLLPIARDTETSLRQAFELAAGADLIVSTGGASVGDHDLVHPVASELGLECAFYKVAMRPGKPLMAGKINGSTLLGLPGNPVSSMVCGVIFMLPMLRALSGLPAKEAPRIAATLGASVGANGPREHYMRARIENGIVTAFERQDSALLSACAGANALLMRPPNDPERAKGDSVTCVAF